MINLIQIDKSGSDILEKDYSIVLIINKNNIYGINIPQKLKDKVLHEFNLGNLFKKTNKNTYRTRLRVRLHTATVILLLRKGILDLKIAGDIVLEICNDFDGHFHEIKDMIHKHLIKLIPSINSWDILQVKFVKPSFIDEVGEKIRKRDINKLENYHSVEIKAEELIEILRK
ncbi:MAG: hypothetical protein AABX11_00570 [Nanoarchaeota archaeon]